nr:MAG TPA: hypothetical protein [Caudoviricetes sp.]
MISHVLQAPYGLRFLTYVISVMVFLHGVKIILDVLQTYDYALVIK